MNLNFSRLEAITTSKQEASSSSWHYYLNERQGGVSDLDSHGQPNWVNIYCKHQAKSTVADLCMIFFAECLCA